MPTTKQLTTDILFLAQIGLAIVFGGSEFLRLLKELQPDEEGFYQQGAQEVENEFLNKNGAMGAASAKDTSSHGLGVGSLRNQSVEKGGNK